MENNRMSEKLWFLENCREETIQQFQKLGKVVRYPKGHICIRAREQVSDVFIILSGKVQMYNLTTCGKKKILFILGKHNIANESISGRYNTIYCETMENCEFYVIRRETILSLMEQDFELTKWILKYQEWKMWRLEHQLKNTVGSIYLERKLASKLWRLARDFGIQTSKGILIDMELSVTFLADLLGVPRENASRACKKLTEQGLIFMEKKKIYVLDSQRMAEFYKNGMK